MDINDISINQVGLSVRSTNALHRHNIHTIGAMMEQTEESLRQIRNLGAKSIAEILSKKEEIQARYQKEDGFSSEKTGNRESEKLLFTMLEAQGKTIDDLELLSAKAYNMLKFNGITHLCQLVGMSWNDLMRIPRMDADVANEILMHFRRYCQNLEQEEDTPKAESPLQSDAEQINDAEHREVILQYIQKNDLDIENSSLSNRSKTHLLRAGIRHLSDCVFMSGEEFAQIKNLGTKSVKEILSWRRHYFDENADELGFFHTAGPMPAERDEEIRSRIFKAYQKVGFRGFSLQELREFLNLPDTISDAHLKKILGRLLAEGEIEYVDFRCYRVYPKFIDYLQQEGITEQRAREILLRRLNGESLESIGRNYNMTRERVRQISVKTFRAIKQKYYLKTKLRFFDEDYYRYLFEHYDFDRKDAAEWLGVSEQIWNYIYLAGIERGNKKLSEALEDTELDAGMRLKIKNYLNRNKIYIDDLWIEKRRSDIEEYVVRKYCQDEVSYDEYTQIYNNFLEEQEIPYDENLYFTDAVIATRKNRLSEAGFLLWKQGAMLRYYDIPGRDFEDLFDELRLEAFHNTEISTLLLTREHPEIMEKYDIRDHYELHNLLKKIVPDGSYHDFHCERMPNIRFGEFNRDEAILDLLLDHAPISARDFSELIYEEYGYQPGVLAGTYLKPFSEYLDHGIYNIEQRAMLEENMKILKDFLQDDFYFLDELRTLYANLFPDADISEINAYNLKRMGFQVLSRYVLRNYESLEAYFKAMLMEKEILDITVFKNRYSSISAFYQVLMNLKRGYDVVEFESNQLISIRRLEKAGITKDDLREFCDLVYENAEEGKFFSAKSIRDSGIQSDLYELGFSDWFYGEILAADPRFSFGKVFGSTILCRGDQEISIRAFLTERIRIHRSVDIYDLLSELIDTYGCETPDRYKIVNALQGTGVFYDEILERFYANSDLYYREIDEMGANL